MTALRAQRTVPPGAVRIAIASTRCFPFAELPARGGERSSEGNQYTPRGCRSRRSLTPAHMVGNCGQSVRQLRARAFRPPALGEHGAPAADARTM
jgi:hypothetical protein